MTFAPNGVLIVLSLPFQVKELVFAFLNESDLTLSDDLVEAIINKVHITG